jgi:DNA-binding transcriptional regulator YiaG
LKLLQKDVAGILGVDTNTITNWEKNRCRPKLHLRPKLLQFLDLDPFPDHIASDASLGEGIRSRRKMFGLSQKRLAQLLKVDWSTVAKWERGTSLVF